ncbi:MAG TPA: hypothetical protein VM434_00055 [Beijerinckiaceae bacterium]|nr:hypothetical protein [Beijerinckiaceae bacterium]
MTTAIANALRLASAKKAQAQSKADGAVKERIARSGRTGPKPDQDKRAK